VLAERLTEKGIYHTRIAGEGGFLGGRKVVLLSAVEDDAVDTMLAIIKDPAVRGKRPFWQRRRQVSLV